MSFSFCFSPMRRAALFAPDSSLGQGENLFSGSCGIRCRQCFLIFGFVILVASNAFSFLALWHSVPAMPYHFWLCGTRCRQCLLLFGFVVLAAGNALLLSAVCGIRYRRGPSTVRNTHSVLKTGSWGTRRIFRGIRCKKQASTVRKGYSVPETPFSGTEQDSLNRKRVSLALLRK